MAERPGFGDLLEREIERSRVLGAFERACSGEGAALAFVGPPGVGKTSLLAAGTSEAATRGARVIAARATELEHELAFGLARQLLVPPLLSADDDERSTLLGGAAALAAPVLGLAPPGRGEDPVAAALHGLYWLVANLAQASPVVMTVDDLHWGDEASLRFLAYLALRLEGLRVVILAGSRPTEPGPGHDLSERLLGDSFEVSSPALLSLAASTELVRRKLGAAVADQVGHACHRATGGNPFLLGGVLLELADRDLDDLGAALPAIEQAAPETVIRSMLARLERLPVGARRLAQAVAIYPDGALSRHVVGLAGLDEQAGREAADQLARASVLGAGRPLTFLHPIMRSAVYSALADGERDRLHRQAAERLRDEGAAPEAVATHLLATEPNGDPRAFEDLMAAAGAALATGAPDGARRYLDRALGEPVVPVARAAATHLRGLARMLAGDPAAIEDLRAAAGEAGEGPARAAALRDLGRTLAFGFETEAAAAALDDAVEASRPVPDLHARCILDRVWILWSNDRTAPRYAEDMASLDAPEPNGLLGRGMAGYRAMWLAMQCDDAGEAMSCARGAVAGGHLAHEGLDGLPATVFAAMSLACSDHPEEAMDALEVALAAQRATGSLMGLSYGHMAAGMIRIYAGDLAEAESELRIALDFVRGQLAGKQGAIGIASLLAYVTLERSGAEAALSGLEDLEYPPTWAGQYHHMARAKAELAGGRPKDAWRHWQAALAAATVRGWLNPVFPFPWGDLALAASMVGPHDVAVARAEEDLRLARRFGAPGVLGAAQRVAGLVSGGEEGLALLEEAVDTLSRSSARLLHAQALADLGAALRRSNQRSAARAPLRLAVDLARRCSAPVLAARATDELRATGGRVRRDFVTGPESLTPSELRAARLAASGLTNREIAQQLFLTVKTVEMHVGRALAKLSIGSRHELGRALEPPAPLRQSSIPVGP